MEISQNKIRGFRRIALVTTISTYILIFLGGLVRVSGAGLGCPDWPKCFGRWFPPTNISQLPPDIDPTLFNFTLAWIEYVNRFSGIIIGLMILIVALLAIKNFRKIKAILWPSTGAAILVAVQGWHGGQVVSSKLAPVIVSLHAGLALIIVSIMVFITQYAYILETRSNEKKDVFPKGIGFQISLLWLFCIIQIILGTNVRSTLEALAENFPLLNGLQLLRMVGVVDYMHMVLGLLIVGYAGHLGYKILKNVNMLSQYTRQVTWGLSIVAVAQLIVGLLLVLVGVPELTQVFHLWIASLLIGILLIIYANIRQSEGGTNE